MVLDRRVLVGITGASGSVYAERLVEELLKKVSRVYLVVTVAGRQVCRHELAKKTSGFSLLNVLSGQTDPEYRQALRVFSENDLFAPVASGSSAPTHMVVVPCSMGSLARINGGMSSNLLERAADVMLKQQLPLIICPRETPFNSIHLKNMASLADMGAHIVPAMPAFYQKPESIMDLVDFMTGRILETLRLDHELYPGWNTRML